MGFHKNLFIDIRRGEEIVAARPDRIWIAVIGAGS
jgi:hypothetical protein